MIFPVSNTLVSPALPQIKIFQIGRGCDKGILNLHHRDKGQIFAGRRLCDQSQIQLALLQPCDGLGRGLAFNGYLHMGILIDKGLKIGKEHILAKGIADADAQMADVKFLNTFQFLFTPV